MDQATAVPLKKTALHARHKASRAKLVSFGGWEMPVEYTGIAAEHMAVRERAGMFDVSHMGEIEIAGRNALDAVQRISCNDASKLQVGQAQYSGLLTPAGTFVDDLIVYRLAPSHFLLIVNASHIAADYAHIAANLAEVKARIARRAKDWQRAPDDVQLVAVGKTHPAEAIEAALRAGHRLFGENRVQEAAAKFPALRARYPDLRLHLIGPLQTNKIKQAIEVCDAIETVDRDKLAQGLATELAKSGKRIDLFIQVNTGEEPQKAGIAPKDADGLIAEARERWALPVVGLMCIPPMDEEPALHFALLAKIARRNGLNRLSMGMSADFEIAIAEGSTLVRVGTAIFGARKPRGTEG